MWDDSVKGRRIKTSTECTLELSFIILRKLEGVNTYTLYTYALSIFSTIYHYSETGSELERGLIVYLLA